MGISAYNSRGVERNFAGLLGRLKAFAFDYIVIAVYLILLVGLSLLLRAMVPSFLGKLFGREYSAELAGFISVTLPVSLYFVLSEASFRQATWGKRRVRLKVVRTKDGKPLGLARSFARTALKFVPWEMSHAGMWYIKFHPESSWPFIVGMTVVFLLVGLNAAFIALSRSHQALYDVLAGTAVEEVGKPGPLEYP